MPFALWKVLKQCNKASIKAIRNSDGDWLVIVEDFETVHHALLFDSNLALIDSDKFENTTKPTRKEQVLVILE